MLNMSLKENTWIPPVINEDEIIDGFEINEADEFLAIFQVTPYIDFLYVNQGDSRANAPRMTKRFTFHEGYHWNYCDEKFFEDRCLNNPHLVYSYTTLECIFKEYSQRYPGWHLQRYYTKNLRLLDHIYNCYKQNSVKELLYKAGLDELAIHFDLMDEINLLSTKPTELYDGLSMKVIRALNCPAGASLLSTAYNRTFLKELNRKFPDIFMQKFNDAQSMYLDYMIQGGLNVGEVGRLYPVSHIRLQEIWCKSLYDTYLENHGRALIQIKEIAMIDPVYEKNIEYIAEDDQRLNDLIEYLLLNSAKHDREIRRANRRRDNTWKERNHGYLVRYPHTINDFCREAIYMHSNLLSREYAMVHNSTTILFLRKLDAVNQPFITMEVYDGTLTRAYHRYNEECNKKELEWIIDYCNRHDISTELLA